MIVLTSTIGLESALAGKRTYMLGDVFYSYHPACKIVKGFKELEIAIREDIKQKWEIADIQEINVRFITSYFSNTIKGNLFTASRADDRNDYKAIYEKVKAYLCKSDTYAVD